MVRKRILLSTMAMAMLLALAVPSAAQVVSCHSSERFGGELIKVGDSERKVLEMEPDREVLLETYHGGAHGYRYEFYRPNYTIQIYVRSGVVTRICRIPE